MSLDAKALAQILATLAQLASMLSELLAQAYDTEQESSSDIEIPPAQDRLSPDEVSDKVAGMMATLENAGLAKRVVNG